MHIFSCYRRVSVSVALFVALAGSVWAQMAEENGPPAAEASPASWLYGKYLSFYDAYRHDPEYLKNEAGRLKVRLLGTFQSPYFTIQAKNDAEKRIRFDSEPLRYVGADVGWNIFSLGYSLGIDARSNLSNRRLSLNTYSRFFAINTEILWLNSLRVSVPADFMSGDESAAFLPRTITLGDASFRSRSAHVVFFPGGKKMAYGNTINPVFRQLKNAGTVVAALGYADYNLDTNIKNMDLARYEWLADLGINRIDLYKYEFGAGYSYNFVSGNHWVIFVSDMIGISAKHYSYEMLPDHAPTRETKLGGSNYFRAGTCYYNRDYFIGAHVYHEFDALRTSRFQFNKNSQTAVLYVGYKFSINRFNRFVSDLLHINVL
jgi:hypothetical protein